jgi:uncharacterized OB-fold protein
MSRPVPSSDSDTRPFWDAAARGELRYQRCGSCGHAEFPPRRLCSACHEDALEWAPASGEGRIHSFTIVHRAPTEAFRARVPYAIALVDLAEGFRMMMNVEADDLSTIAIGAPIRVTFEVTGSGLALPQARLA